MAAKILHDKKGIFEDAGFWIFRIILIMIVVFSAVFFVNSIIKTNLDTEGLELDIVAARIINTNHCLAYLDDAKRVYPGIIDFDKYDITYLEQSCLSITKDDPLGVKIQLGNKTPIFLNQEYYEDTEPLTFSQKYYKVEKKLPVLIIYNNTKKENSNLDIILVGEKR